LAAVLEARAGEADVCSLLSRCAVGLPAEDSEGSCADFAFSIVIGLEHLYVVVFWEAGLADGGEVGGFPTGAVEILLDLRRHCEGLAHTVE